MAQINKPSEYFNTKLYSGNNSTNAITGVGFQPDLVWIKERSSTSSHRLIDAVRGVGKGLSSNDTGAEQTIANLLTSFDSDGFTVDNDNGTNENGQTYASWNWLGANGTASNTDGSITSTVSANTTSGFSIVSWTGTSSASTIGHGLSKAPEMIIVKNRESDFDWAIYHSSNTSAPETEYLKLNLTDATSDNTVWNDTAPTTSVFSVSHQLTVNESGKGMIAYCFAEKKGFSKFGSYVGNGNADGPFIYTGFKPAFVMFKNTSSALFWQIHDSVRDPFNEVQKRLAPNSSDAEGSGSIPIDFLSNGIKLRTTATTWNESGSNFIYMAFAEAPLVGSNNVPATAR